MKSLENRVADLEAIVRAQGALLMSLISAAELLTEGTAKETVDFAHAQAQAAQQQGNGLSAVYLFNLVEQIRDTFDLPDQS